MHIALVSHNVFEGDGQGLVNLELVRFLLEQGHEVTLIAHKVAENLTGDRLNWIPIEVGPMVDAVDLLKVWVFKRKADRLLHSIGEEFSAVIACGVVLSVPHELNVVHFAHGGWLRSPYHPSKTALSVDSAYQWLFSNLNDRWERQTLSRADHIVAVSGMVEDELINSGISSDKISVIINGVDLNKFRPGDADRKALGLPPKTPLGLFVGDLRSTIKNPDGILHALRDAPGVNVAFIGSLAGSDLPALADKLGLSQRVHFLGFRQDIDDIMRATDFFLLPSRRDSCPLVLLEAMASGLPAIVSNNVGTANLVDGEAGFVLDKPDNYSDLAEYIRLLAHNETVRTTFAQNARSVAEHYSWDRMAERYLRLIYQKTRLLTSKSPHPT